MFKLLFTVGNRAFQTKPGGEREAEQQLQEEEVGEWWAPRWLADVP